jgi:predicted nucleotidyltransferase
MLDTLRPLFASLSDHGVEYVVIGGVAAIAYGVPRVTLDIDMTRTPGVEFDAAYARRKTVDVEGVPVHLVALDDLIATKKAAGRERDLEDVKILETLRP